MAEKIIYFCDICGAEIKNFRFCNVFDFEDEEYKGSNYNKFTLGIIRERDSVNGLNKTYYCEKCFLKYIEQAATQLKKRIESEKSNA